MAVLVVILFIAACVAGVLHNRSNAAAALGGVEFHVNASSRDVRLAITNTFCGGAKAGLRSFVSGVSVSPAGGGFTYKTKHGDVGKIAVRDSGAGSVVSVSATELFVGNTEVFKRQRPGSLHATAVGMLHGILLVLNVTPNAAKMKRFANGLQPKLANSLGSTAIAASDRLEVRSGEDVAV